MDIISWYKKRGIGFIFKRSKRLYERYGFSSRKSIDRIKSCVDSLYEFGCSPTFAVPGLVVKHNRSFIQSLQQLGVEIAVHGYNHVDLKSNSPQDSVLQLKHAADLFCQEGLEVHGFRCPYLSASDELIKAIPPGVFEYSSNKAIQWNIKHVKDPHDNLMFNIIESFYTPESSDTCLCLPWFQEGLIEIPICVPDDLQLHDGLGYNLEQISQVWLDILQQTHQRGEVFNLMFHPELASFCETPFLTILKEARSLKPKVWVASLKDISAWWKEMSTFQVETEYSKNHITITFHCTPRATILGRGLDTTVPSSQWDASYRRIETGILSLDVDLLPFIGLPSNIPQWVEKTLHGMGYILSTGEKSLQCSLYLDEACLGQLGNQVELVAYIESRHEPLLRFWPWPDGARSALCITGDLDALSLLDYAMRLVIK